MRTIKFRARFRKISTGQEIWQFAELQKGHITNPIQDLPSGYVQVSEWEQFSGLKDATGVEIFEGDIWQRGSFIATIDFKYSQWILNKTESSGSYEYPYFYSNATTGIVIGNIHENPELLEV